MAKVAKSVAVEAIRASDPANDTLSSTADNVRF